MQDEHIRLRIFQLFFGQNIAVLQADIVLLVEKALFLHARHIEYVEIRHGCLQTVDLGKRNLILFEHIFPDIARNPEFRRRNQHKANAGVTDQGTDQRMNRAAKLQVAAKSDRHVIKPSLQRLYGHEICQSLCRMLVAAITRVDNRYARKLTGNHRCTFLGMTHGNNVGIAGNDANRVGDALSFARRTRIGGLET